MEPDFDAIHLVHRHLQKKMGLAFQGWFLKEHDKLSVIKKFELTPEAYGERALPKSESHQTDAQTLRNAAGHSRAADIQFREGELPMLGASLAAPGDSGDGA